jgi:hypothetical protein
MCACTANECREGASNVLWSLRDIMEDASGTLLAGAGSMFVLMQPQPGQDAWCA